MAEKTVKPKELKGFSGRNVAIALAAGFLVSAILIYTSWDAEAFRNLKLGQYSVLLILLAFIMMFGRHIAYMYRVWLVTDRVLSIRQAFESITMWEFASAVTPSTVGGAAVAMFILNREKINLGKSTASVMVITMMDNLFFILAGGMFFLLVGSTEMFGLGGDCNNQLDSRLITALGGLQYVFMIGYIFSFVITTLISYGIFVNPKGIKKLLSGIFSWRILKRWKPAAAITGDEIIITSRELKSKPVFFWVQLFVVTSVAWTLKYLVVNSVISAFGEITGSEQIVIMSRVLALWIVMLIPFTPGASGLAELTFFALMCSFVPNGVVATIALLWRGITYYPYLILGAIIMPRWLRRVYSKSAKEKAARANEPPLQS